MPTSAAAKLVTVWGLLGKSESGYGTAATMTTTVDGILLMEEAVAQIGYLHDGEHAPNAGSGGMWRPAAPSGKYAKFTAKCEVRGAGTAYAAATLPPDVPVLMLASGHSKTVATTGGSESVTFANITPPLVAATSASFDAYARGMKFPMTGAYADFGFDLEAGGFIVFNFDVQALCGAPTDVTLPTITYSAVQPAKAASITLTIGSWSPVVRKVSFKKNAVITARADANQAGHAGFAIGRRAPEITITVESPAIATGDPWGDQLAGTARAIALTVGATQYNRVKFNAAQAYLKADGIKEGSDGGIATLDLTYRLATSTPGAEDDYTVVFD